MGVDYCISSFDSNHCLECRKGYGLSGDCDKDGCSVCVKCSTNCNLCYENHCFQCKCGYYLNPLNNFECIKGKIEYMPTNYQFPNYSISQFNTYPPNYPEPECNNEYFIKINFILLIIFLLLLKLH